MVNFFQNLLANAPHYLKNFEKNFLKIMKIMAERAFGDRPIKKMKKIFWIFVISFLLNLIWENLQSFLYLSYQGGKITELILWRAALADALIITAICLPFIFIKILKHKSWLIIISGILISIAIELFARYTGRWTYQNSMPIIPFLNIGLAPMLQLGLLGYLSFGLADFNFFYYDKKIR
jgi:hypothetical protein